MLRDLPNLVNCVHHSVVLKQARDTVDKRVIDSSLLKLDCEYLYQTKHHISANLQILYTKWSQRDNESLTLLSWDLSLEKCLESSGAQVSFSHDANSSSEPILSVCNACSSAKLSVNISFPGSCIILMRLTTYWQVALSFGNSNFARASSSCWLLTLVSCYYYILKFYNN